MEKIWPRRDSNPQSSDPKSDALSIRPRGRPFGQTEIDIIKITWTGNNFWFDGRAKYDCLLLYPSNKSDFFA